MTPVQTLILGQSATPIVVSGTLLSLAVGYFAWALWKANKNYVTWKASEPKDPVPPDPVPFPSAYRIKALELAQARYRAAR